jgi:hypothetical protein
MRTPFIIILSRLIILVVWGVVCYLLCHAVNGFNLRIFYLTLGITVICFLPILLSFIRSRWSLWFFSISCTVIPLIFWLSFDVSGIVHGAWWEFLIAFFIQMAIPIGLSCELLFQKKVHIYYSIVGQ